MAVEHAVGAATALKRKNRKKKCRRKQKHVKYTLDQLIMKGWIICWTAEPL